MARVALAPSRRAVCSAKIHHRRADELRAALTDWEADGHAATLVTITVPHDLADPLSKLVDAERAAGRRSPRERPGSA